MNRHITRWLVLSLGLGGGSLHWGRAAEGEGGHDDRAAVGQAAAGPARQYAPSRKADILHLALDITPDFEARAVTGTARFRFKPIALPLDELALDAVALDVREVSASEPVRDWHTTETQLIVTFQSPIAPDRETALTIRYAATPRQGLYFRTPETGYPAWDMQLWTQGESVTSRHWFPCFDAPNEKFTSEITCRVPRGMTVLSNGHMVSKTPDPASCRVAVRWLQDKPHVAYLISLVAGYFEGLHDRYRDIPLAFYTPASQFACASNSFRGTADMLAFYEEHTGVPYPWAKYYQVCVLDFVVGGMENTSLTTLTDRTLHPPEFEGLRSSQGLVAHELAHQWFGDLVTCKDWAHIWLNEGFATYYETLYDAHKHGPDQLRYRMHQAAEEIFKHPNDTNAIVRRDFRHPDDQFSYLAYPKGAWVLHMLRSQLGDPLFRRCVQTFLQRFQYRTAVTADLVAVFEELSGRSLDRFFDQWVFHAHYPELTVDYRWDERAGLARVTVRQTQKLGAAVLLFHVPLKLRFHGPFESLDRTLTVSAPTEDFHVPLPRRPTIVRPDPDVELLATIAFNPPAPMLHAQLTNRTDMIGRLLAARQLGRNRDDATVAQLHTALNSDPFHAVRLAAAKALDAIGTDAALAALRASTAQPHPQVRQHVIQALTRSYRPDTAATALAFLKSESNPILQAEALRALAPYPTPDVRATLAAFLSSNSFHHILADAAIATMRAQDDPAHLQPLLARIRTHAAAFTPSGLAQALDALAWLARHQNDKRPVRDLLSAHLHHPNERLRRAAVTALGTLRDPQALAALETFTRAPEPTPLRRAAEQAVAALRESRPPAVDLGALRQEVLDLQRAQRELRRELDALKKKAP
ncbi:MAG: M1 family metallopeptidase [Verrucomicrobia bacterium]|nr:M1 family metallopeptidase [Verrucomicrobiota bacterium]